MISETLKTKSLDLLAEIESIARDEGYQEAKKNFDSQYAKLKDEYELKIKAAFSDGYNARASEESGTTPTITPDHEPINDPVDDPVNEGYSRDKVISELLAIKGTSAYAFGIIDVYGNVYANVSEWILDKTPLVLGIGFTDGTHFLCMKPNKVQAAKFGGYGINFGEKVHTTKKQWHKDTTAKECSAFDDFSGISNTIGIKEKCDDSIVANCMEYMPACAELRVFCKHFQEVDVLLKGIGGDVLRPDKGNLLYWTSTCRDAENAWAVLFGDNYTAQPAYRAKTTKLQTRQFVVL